MDIGRKEEIARAAIASITRHDDAPAGDVRSASERLAGFIAGETQDLEGARDERRRAREDALRDVTMVERTTEIVTQDDAGRITLTPAPELDINSLG